MIVFSGDVSEKNKKFLLRTIALWIFTLVFCATILGSLFWARFLFSDGLGNMAAVMLIAWAIILVAPVIFTYVSKNQIYKWRVPIKIVFDKNQDSFSVNYAATDTATNIPMSTVKSVVDKDDMYYIKLSFPQMVGVICQKSLLVEGSTKEFEELFADKLVRKH